MTAKRKLWVTVTAIVMVLSLLASILLAFADEYVPEPVTPVYEPIPTPSYTGAPFTDPGNGEVQDHVEDGTGSKEFYTVQTHNGNTFYLVIDKDRMDDNAYLLSQVDENDLMEFTEETMPEPTPEVVLEETPEPEETEPEPKKGRSALWTILLLLLLGGAAAVWYFRYYRPGQNETTVTAREGLEKLVEMEDLPEEKDENAGEETAEAAPAETEKGDESYDDV